MFVKIEVSLPFLRWIFVAITLLNNTKLIFNSSERKSVEASRRPPRSVQTIYFLFDTQEEKIIMAPRQRKQTRRYGGNDMMELSSSEEDEVAPKEEKPSKKQLQSGWTRLECFRVEKGLLTFGWEQNVKNDYSVVLPLWYLFNGLTWVLYTCYTHSTLPGLNCCASLMIMTW